MKPANELKVFITSRASTCSDCGAELPRSAWITLTGESQALCLECADLSHLVFLPAGDATLTRRARKHSPVTAVVLKWSKARKRYERQGLLVTEEAIETAEQACLEDAEARKRQRERAARKRAERDEQFVAAFAAKVREWYPACPPNREFRIAEHACLKYSGRIGRTRAARDLEAAAVQLAVRAHVRHTETPYDDWLGRGVERTEARGAVEEAVGRVLEEWGGG